MIDSPIKMASKVLKERLYQIAPLTASSFNEYDKLHSFLQGKGLPVESLDRREMNLYLEFSRMCNIGTGKTSQIIRTCETYKPVHSED